VTRFLTIEIEAERHTCGDCLYLHAPGRTAKCRLFDEKLESRRDDGVDEHDRCTGCLDADQRLRRSRGGR
jgi:hypothetical protein